MKVFSTTSPALSFLTCGLLIPSSYSLAVEMLEERGIHRINSFFCFPADPAPPRSQQFSFITDTMPLGHFRSRVWHWTTFNNAMAESEMRAVSRLHLLALFWHLSCWVLLGRHRLLTSQLPSHATISNTLNKYDTLAQLPVPPLLRGALGSDLLQVELRHATVHRHQPDVSGDEQMSRSL